ncbi:MAG TPA: type II toxin-antitoxin system HicA family toxin [Thermoplasmata archaeon]|nr:type II toxin-antitoxin system HicA family toxin [Thermoplasmata archaeon]
MSGRDVIKVLVRAGWTPARQRGSHVTLVKRGNRPVSIPTHAEVRRGTLRHLIGQAGLTVEEFIRILHEL